MSQPQPADGDLPAARWRLADTISQLIDPRAEIVENRTYWTDSYYDQLCDSLPGNQGTGHSPARSLPPIWLDAEDLLRRIDTQTAAHYRTWETVHPADTDLHLEPVTVLRLKVIDRRTWRPQDTSTVNSIAADIEGWVIAIRNLLHPLPKWHLPNPCPACNTSTVHRRDSGGELIRQPALQIGPLGCECMKCRTVWAPDYFTHLARVLGYEMPAGVLE